MYSQFYMQFWLVNIVLKITEIPHIFRLLMIYQIMIIMSTYIYIGTNIVLEFVLFLLYDFP
jgi:hypothetical protein